MSRRTITARDRYLHLPVTVGAPARRLSVRDAELVRSFSIELSESEPEWWGFLDLTPFNGRVITIELDGDDSNGALDRIHQSDEIVGADSLYRESKRPQLRFSARRGWVNDPNGLVFFEGEYHLFYQHNPFGLSVGQLGNMSWGHAVSRDLVHWDELPVALHPDRSGPVFSGSAVVDWNNTSGLQQGAEPPLIAIYTAHGKPVTQGIASSNDRGRTWTKYSGNPVIPLLTPENRDPRVFWHEPTGRWVMVLYLDDIDLEKTPEVDMPTLFEYRRTNRFALFSSGDLKSWSKLSEIALPEDGECPELVELPIAGAEDERRWIFFGGNGRYLIGSFDGDGFTAEAGPFLLYQGDCAYAGQTFSDIPASDGRRILMAWGMAPKWDLPPNGRQPVFAGMPFNQSMTLPLELTLRRTDDGLRVFVEPVRELAALRASTNSIDPRVLRPGDDPLSATSGELWEIDAELEVGDAKRLVFELRGVSVTYDVARQELSCLESSAPLLLVDDRVRLRIFVDRTAIDVFGGDGLVYMPIGIDLTAGPESVSLRSEGGDAIIRSLDVHELESSWNSAT